jgi:hypothetical protein
MKLLLITLLSALALSGCGSTCTHSCILGFGPGNPAFNRVADYYDRRDECQSREFSSLTGERLKPAGYTYRDFPSYCGAGGRSISVTGPTGQTQRYTVRTN